MRGVPSFGLVHHLGVGIGIGIEGSAAENLPRREEGGSRFVERDADPDTDPEVVRLNASGSESVSVSNELPRISR